VVDRPIGRPMDDRVVTVPARDASTVCLVRDGERGLEVLMVRRTPAARFMGGAWVFPGGAVDAEDGSRSSDDSLDRWRSAAVRELVEETGIWLMESGPRVTARRPSGAAVFAGAAASGDRFSGSALRYFSRWITPAPLPIRFDARFFAAAVPPGLDPVIDNGELVDFGWVRPRDALDRAAERSWIVAFPTLRTVGWFARFASVDDLMEDLDRIGSIEPVQPRLSVSDHSVRILVPGDDGYEAAADDERRPDVLTRLSAVVAAGGDVPPDFGPVR